MLRLRFLDGMKAVASGTGRKLDLDHKRSCFMGLKKIHIYILVKLC